MDGDFDINSTYNFSKPSTTVCGSVMIILHFLSIDTIGIESVTITDSSNGSVCIECIFTLFSTDIGFTVELISSSINYTNTFNRSRNTVTVTGCISNVNTGQYTIRVYGSRYTRHIRTETITVVQPTTQPSTVSETRHSITPTVLPPSPTEGIIIQ